MEFVIDFKGVFGANRVDWATNGWEKVDVGGLVGYFEFGRVDYLAGVEVKSFGPFKFFNRLMALKSGKFHEIRHFWINAIIYFLLNGFVCLNLLTFLLFNQICLTLYKFVFLYPHLPLLCNLTNILHISLQFTLYTGRYVYLLSRLLFVKTLRK